MRSGGLALCWMSRTQWPYVLGTIGPSGARRDEFGIADDGVERRGELDVRAVRPARGASTPRQA